MEKQGNIIQVLDAHKTLRFFEEYREVPIEHHWRGSPLRGRRTLAETGRGTYTPGQSRVPSLVTLTSKGQPCSTSSGAPARNRAIFRLIRATVSKSTWFGNLVPVRVLSERGNSYTDNTVVGFTVLELRLTLPAPSSCYLPCLVLFHSSSVHGLQVTSLFGPLSDVSPWHGECG